MRAALTRRVLSRVERHTPNWVRCAETQILLNLASRSFGLPGRRIWHLSVPEALRAYAAYTVECMEQTAADPKRLYEGAFQLGRKIRRLTGLREPCDIRRLVFYLYQNLCITMSGRLPGEIMVPRCYFSAFYSPEQCGLMSQVDAGIIAGLYGGGQLHFTERLTEGCAQCKAVFQRGKWDEK